jgi:thiol:disulfide interchange protein DsbD
MKLTKLILLISIFISTILAQNNNFVQPNEAFKIKMIKQNDHIQINIDLYKNIYIYKNKLKILVNKKDITTQLKLPKPSIAHKEKVFFGKLNIQLPQNISIETITVKYQGCSSAGLCYAPMSKTFEVTKKSSDQLNETDTITQTLKSKNIFFILITFFGFGLLLALTPCIFPMIPILSSIIVQQSNQNSGKMSASRGFFLSLIYVLSMSVAYTIAGVFAGLFGANIQVILQNPYVVVGFATIFVALAFSMFGYYEIGLPQSWQSKLNQTSENKSKKGGILGVAIMGFLSALIVGPCVAPPLAGALVYIGQTGDAILGGSALFVMSLGMGMPLLLIGAGSGKFMPKPGGWMNTVSKVFGVVMLGIAIYMLDKILPQTIIFWLWAILFIGTALYLIKNGNIFGKILAILLLIGGIYFIKISFDTNKSNHLQITYIHNIEELNQELNHTKQPIMLDFWATWCVSCKELEEKTFSNKKVQQSLKNYKILKVDVSNNTNNDKALQKRFNIFGPPALIFFDKDGKEIKHKRVIGFKPPKEFLKIVNQ